MNNVTKLNLKILLLITASLLFSVSSYGSIEVEPMRIETQAGAGETVTGYLTLTSIQEKPIEISFSSGEYRYMFSPGVIYPDSPKGQALPSCKNWISFKPDKIRLEKYKPQKVQYTIKVPQAANTEHLAAILIDQEQNQDDLTPPVNGQARVKITPRLSVPVYVLIKNSAVQQYIISELTASVGAGLPARESTMRAAKAAPTFAQDVDNTIVIETILKNTGTTHIRPLTKITITDDAGNLVENINAGKSLPVFPGFGEKVQALWKPKGPGEYAIVATVETENQSLIQKSLRIKIER